LETLYTRIGVKRFYVEIATNAKCPDAKGEEKECRSIIYKGGALLLA
jgi:hypothetical protein